LALLINAIDYSHFSTINLNETTGIKFIQNLVYHDSKLEKVTILQEEVNGNESIYCKSDNQNIIESLGNIEMNKYYLETNDELDVFKIKALNKLLYKYAPFPDCAGTYRTDDNMILGDPISFSKIYDKMDELNAIIKTTIENIDKYTLLPNTFL